MKRNILLLLKKLLIGITLIVILIFLLIELILEVAVNQIDFDKDLNSKLIPIDDRPDYPNRPSNVGWCGEASIQMAAIYYGAFIPQTLINKIANPKNPDLYYYEIPVSLQRLSLNYNSWYDIPNYLGIAMPYIQSLWRGKNYNLDKFINWIKYNISKSYPVLIGVKLYPYGNPDWPLDHFMLAIGFDEKDLVYNPNYHGTEKKPVNQLKNKAKGYSFHNKYNYYYGYAVTGFNFKDLCEPISLNVMSESINEASVQILVDEIELNRKYELVKYTADTSIQELILSVMDKQSLGVRFGKDIHQINKDTISKNFITIYRCYERQ